MFTDGVNRRHPSRLWASKNDRNATARRSGGPSSTRRASCSSREGYQNVSIRKIAERIEYSPAAIYGYFPSKDDIFFALAEEGFRLLGDPAAVRDAALETLPPLERLRAIFWRLYEFSREQPQYFALMFVDRSVPRISREYERFAFAREMQAAHHRRSFSACIDAGDLPRHGRSARRVARC